MKIGIMGALAMVLLAGPIMANAAAVAAGQTLRYNFDFTGDPLGPSYNSSVFHIEWVGDGMNAAESFALGFYDDSGTQLATYRFTAWDGSGNVTSLASSVDFAPLPSSLNGFLLLQWEVGTSNVSGIDLLMRFGAYSYWRNTETRYASFVGVVPEPGTLALSSLGLAGLVLAGRGKGGWMGARHTQNDIRSGCVPVPRTSGASGAMNAGPN